MYESSNILGYDIFTDDIFVIKLDCNKKQIINTINPHSYIIAKNDNPFKDALKKSDVLMPDGSGILLAAKQIKGVSIKRITGTDLHCHLLCLLHNSNGSVFYLGSSLETLNRIHDRIEEECLNIRVGSYSPLYTIEFTDSENAVMINEINAFNPDVLFIGMTAPKQEKWLHAHKDKINFKIAASIGAVFDFYAGTVKRPSPFWINFHLEWLPRFLKEPRRLWRRNFISSPLFLLDILFYKMGIKK